MIRGITLGQYYPVESPIHKLDPRTKLLGTIVFIAALFVADNVICYILGAAFLFGMIALARIPIGRMLRGLRALIFILCFTVIFNLFFTDGRVLVQVWVIKITWEGLVRTITMAIRLVFLVMGASLLTYTTTPNELTDGIERGLRFLNVLRVPVHEMAMMMSIALRFIPILVEETDRIMKAQMARGADFDTGGLIKRARAMIPLLVPLFVSSFRRASDLALAMEARCYHGGKGRTKMKPLHYKKRDGISYLIMFAFLAAEITGRIFL